MYGPILALQLDCSHYKCEINTWDPWNCVASIASVQTTFPFSEGKNTGQTVHSSSSTVRYPHEGWPRFLTCQKYIWPSDCWSGEANLLHDKRCTTKLKSGPIRRRVIWKPDALLKGAAAVRSHSFSWSLFFSAKHITNRPQGKISNNKKHWMNKTSLYALNQVKTAGHHFFQRLPCYSICWLGMFCSMAAGLSLFQLVLSRSWAGPEQELFA